MTADPAARDPSDPAPASPDPDTWLDEAFPAEVVRQSIDAIVITDAAFRVRVWNPAAERLYGIPAASAIGRGMAENIESLDSAGRPIDTPTARADLGRTGEWRQRVIHRPRHGPKAGQEVVVDALITLLRRPDGTPVGALGVNRDVTASARLEAEMAALGSVVIATGRARTKAEVASAALDILCRATGADAGLVTSTDAEYEAIAHLGARPETIEVIVNYGQLGGPLAQALAAPDAFVSADVATAPLREDVRAAILADGIQHLIVVGLRLGGRLTGVLALGWRRTAPHEPSRPIMRQAAALVASSLENARLLAAVESGLREERLLTGRMRALMELTRLPDTVSTGDPAGSVDRLIADVDEVIGADGTLLAAVVDERVMLTNLHRIDAALAAPLVNRPLSSFLIAAPLVDGAQSVLIPLDAGRVNAQAAAASADEGYRTLAAFAIRDDGQLVGILAAMFKRPLDQLEIDERTLDAIGRVLDISFANRRLREVVGASERRYRELFEYAPDALLVQSLDEIVLDANPAAHRLYGEGLIGSRVADLAITAPVAAPSGDDPDGSAKIVRSSTGIGRRLDGSTFPEEVELRTIEIGGERRVMAIVRDLTERTRLQGELVQAQKMEAIGMLVAGVAHELNNPLAAIVAFSQLLRTDPALPADLRTQADLLVQEANRTRVIVQNLLDFARQRPPERVPIDLRSLVDSVLGLQSYMLRNQLTVTVDIPADLPPLLADRSQMQQVLINLTLNAAQAIRDRGGPGSIRLEARPALADDRPVVRIAVIDDGPAVPAEILDRLFMPFVTTKEPGEGTGLGLSVSFGIVAGHGGTLRYEATPGGGATFIIELPAGAAATAAPPQPWTRGTADPDGATRTAMARTQRSAPAIGTDATVAAGAPATRARPVDRPMRVLVLDDEPSIRDFLGRVLTRSGYEPILAATGSAAMESIRADPPDAILCDHRMAGMTGTEFHSLVMEIAPHLAGRFAFMSGDVLNPELREFAEARDVQLLAKPFDIATVAAVVSSLLVAEAG